MFSVDWKCGSDWKKFNVLDNSGGNRKRMHFLRVIHKLISNSLSFAWFKLRAYEWNFCPLSFLQKSACRNNRKRQILSRLFKQRKFVQSIRPAKNWNCQLHLAFTIIVYGRRNAVGLITKMTWKCQVPAQIEYVFSAENLNRPHQQP
jgi:hypothetical protein